MPFRYTDPASAGIAASAAVPKQSAAAVSGSFRYRAAMFRLASSKGGFSPSPARSVHRDVDRGGLLKQRVVPGVLEDRCDAGVVVDRAGGGDAAGIGGTDDGIAAHRTIAQRPVERVVRVDVDAAPVLSTELRRRHGRAGQPTKDAGGSRRHAQFARQAWALKAQS